MISQKNKDAWIVNVSFENVWSLIEIVSKQEDN